MTKEDIGAVLKRARLACNMTQKEAAEKIGRKQQIIGHWETGYAQPDANTLFMLCNIYGVTVDEAFGFTRKTEVTLTEYKHIEKYRILDDHGKDMVDTVLTKEHDRCKAIIEAKEKAEIIELAQPVLNAAHTRTDIAKSEKTDDLRQQEEDIMDDPDF